MTKLNLFIIITVFLFSCSKNDESLSQITSEPEPEIKILGEKEFVLEHENLDPERIKALMYLKLHVNDLNEYIVAGITRINKNEKWGKFILNTNDTLSKQYFELPDELSFDGNIYGGELSSKLVENNNILIFGTLNNSQCIIAKYSSKGEKIWFKTLVGDYSDVQIVDIIKLQNNYFYIAMPYKTWSYGAASLITNVGKISLDGDIIFNKTLADFSLGYNIEKYDENSFLITSAKFLANDEQSFDMGYNKVQPFVINIDTSGNILWESSINELDTDLFHPVLFYSRKGTDGIYCVYNKRSVSHEAFLTKLDLEGNVLWTKAIDNLENFLPYYTFRKIYDITLDNQNNIYFTGYATKDIVWGPGYLGVAKFDSNGEYLNSYTNHVHSFQNSNPDNRLTGYGIKIDKQGDVIVVCENKDEDITFFKLNKNLELL
ncbi:hypothetical protein [Seonamhaeicola sp.]|uniref:hypothetical protein n=1 Tax=Seonamhaeicola sp. TaxID=1912245 RepID=UPI0026050070|nr:hypothetical protein [Seonamhaeicola sp.]